MMPALVHVLWVAVPWYVDADARCGGDGSDAAPFCSLQDAFANTSLAAGDEILVRTAAATYAGAQIGGAEAPAPVSGTEAEPIVLRPDDGHSPVLTGTVTLIGCSHWTVRGLVFHGEGDASPVSAIEVYDDGTGEVHGIVIEDNTILDFGGAPVLEEGDYSAAGLINLSSFSDGTPMLVAPVVRNNRIRSSRGAGIHMRSTAGARIEGNEIAELGCQLDLSYLDEDGVTWVTQAAVIGIRAYDATDARITGNRVLDLDAAECTPFDVGSWLVHAIWLRGAEDAEVDRNFVGGIGQQSDYGCGVEIADGSNDARVHHNIIVDADLGGVCNGIDASSGGDRARIVNNTIVGGRAHGIDIAQGEDAEVHNNLVSGADDAAIRILGIEGWVTAWSADHNLYWDEGSGAAIGQLGWDPETDLATWQRNCACDANSIVGDPILPSGTAPEDFTVAATSPAVDAGLELVELDGYNGAAPDVGALEAPLPVGASVSAEAPTEVRLVVDHYGDIPLVVDASCLGLAVLVEAEPVALVGCTVVEATTIVVELAEPLYAGQEATLLHAGATITDSARIGGIIDAFMGPFELTVDNGAVEDPPAGTDGGTTSTGSDDGASSDTADEPTTAPADDAGYPDAATCECRSGSPSERGLVALAVFVLGLRSRRRRK